MGQAPGFSVFARKFWAPLALMLMLAGCARTPQPEKTQPTLFFPPPPNPARVQYLGAINSTADLPQKRNSFADFVLGPEEIQYPLAKPIAARQHGQTLYVCDTTFNRVILYDLATGKGSLLQGDRGNGKIMQPNNLDIDTQGNLDVADRLRGAVLVYGPDGTFLHAWGRPGEVEPVDVKIGDRYLYVCDMKDNQI